MTMTPSMLTTDAGQVIAATSSSSSEVTGFAALLLLSGFVFYGITYLRYRNVDKRYRHAVETDSTVHNMRAGDQRAGKLRGVSHRTMRGANNLRVSGVQQHPATKLMSLLPRGSRRLLGGLTGVSGQGPGRRRRF